MKAPDKAVIEKTFNNKATPAEARQVAGWLATSNGQEWLARQMEQDQQSIREGEEEEWIEHPIPTGEMYQKIMKKIRAQKIRRFLLWAAAICIPLVSIATLFFEVNSRVDLFASAEYDEIYVPRGERLQVVFPDGSKVLLNSGSRLRYPKKFGWEERNVELEGEGWFEIARKKNRPFIVDLDAVRVNVLGTTFNVKAYPGEEEITVSLESGRIKLEGQTFRPFPVNPGETAIYNRTTGICKITRPDIPDLYFAWKQHIFIFNNTPLEKVLKELARSYNSQFIVEDEEVYKYEYTLRTQHTSLPLILKELETLTPVRFEEEEEDKITIRLKKNKNILFF